MNKESTKNMIYLTLGVTVFCVIFAVGIACNIMQTKLPEPPAEFSPYMEAFDSYMQGKGYTQLDTLYEYWNGEATYLTHGHGYKAADGKYAYCRESGKYIDIYVPEGDDPLALYGEMFPDIDFMFDGNRTLEDGRYVTWQPASDSALHVYPDGNKSTESRVEPITLWYAAYNVEGGDSLWNVHALRDRGEPFYIFTHYSDGCDDVMYHILKNDFDTIYGYAGIDEV